MPVLSRNRQESRWVGKKKGEEDTWEMRPGSHMLSAVLVVLTSFTGKAWLGF
jgi:hypothetical protein